MNYSLHFIHNHSSQSIPSILIQINQKKYLFNVCESYLRFLPQTKIINNLSSHNIFFTNLSLNSMGGLFPLLFSFSLHSKGKDTRIYGPPGLIPFIEKIKFLMGLSFVKYSFYEFNEQFNEKYLIKGINNREKFYRFMNKNTSLDDNFIKYLKTKSNSEINDASENINKEYNIFHDGFIKIVPIIKSSKNKKFISYIIIIEPSTLIIPQEIITGFSINDKSIEFFKNFGEIILKKDKKLFARDFPDSNNKKKIIILIDCPDLDTLNQFKQDKHLEEIYKQNLNINEFDLQMIIHITPESIVTNKNYKDFFEKFDENCQHLVFYRNEIKTVKILNHFKINNCLNEYFKNYFPKIEIEKFEVLNQGNNLKKMFKNVNLFSNQLFYDFNLKKFVTLKNFDQRKIIIKEDQKNFDINYKNFFIKSQKTFKKFEFFDPYIAFLGTSSAISTNLRNVSSIFITLSDDFKNSLLLDCGEGTYFQLETHFGKAKIDDILLSLKGIFVSHNHFDHHLGIFEILRKRNEILEKKKMDINENCLFLIIPSNLVSWINHFSKLIDGLNCFKIILTKDLSVVSNKKKENDNINFKLLINNEEENEKFEYLHFQNKEKTIESIYQENLTLLRKLLNSLDIESFFTVPTNHCQESHSIIFSNKNHVKIVYTGDTAYCEEILKYGKNATLFIHEATFIDENLALDFDHSTPQQAIKLGEKIQAWRTVLTHFSKRNQNIDPDFIKFQNSKLDFYKENNVVFAFDHLKGKLSEFENLVFAKNALYYLIKRENFD